jgi:hypothetical protein
MPPLGSSGHDRFVGVGTRRISTSRGAGERSSELRTTKVRLKFCMDAISGPDICRSLAPMEGLSAEQQVGAAEFAQVGRRDVNSKLLSASVCEITLDEV